MKKFTAILLLFFNVLLLLGANIQGASPSQRQCANADCSAPISKAKTILRYFSSQKGSISFPVGVEVEVLSKHKDGWDVKLGQKIGRAPPSFLREMKIYVAPEALVTVNKDVASEVVKIEATRKESIDNLQEKTEEIPAGVGSFLNIPAMAAAQDMDSQRPPITPSSPQYEVIDNTTVWADPQPSDEGEQPPQQKDQIVEAAPAVPNSINAADSSLEPPPNVPVAEPNLTMSGGDEAPIEVTKSAESDVPEVTPVPFENYVTAPPIEVMSESPLQVSESSTEAPIEVRQEAATAPPVELSRGETTASTVEITQEATTVPSAVEDIEVTTPFTSLPEDASSSPDIQPTQAGIMSNLWTMFNSGDGTEEGSEENEADEEGDDGDEGDEEEEGDEGSTEEGSAPASKVTETPTGPDASVSADVIASKVVVENILNSIPQENLASSFPPIESNLSEDKARVARQTEPGEEVTSEEVREPSFEQLTTPEQLKPMESSYVPDVDKQTIEAGNGVTDKQEPQQEIGEPKKEEVLNPNEGYDPISTEGLEQENNDELERLQAEAQQAEQLKQLQEQEAEKQKQEKIKLEEEEKKHQQEELERLQEQENAKRLQEEAERQREEENRRILEAEQELYRQTQERQRQEEEARQLEEARMREEARIKEEVRILEETRLKEEARILEETRLKEEARILEETRLKEEAKILEMQQVVSEEEGKDVKSDQNVQTGEEPESASGGMFAWFPGFLSSSGTEDSAESEQEANVEETQPPPEVQQSSPPLHDQPSHTPDHKHQHPPVWSSDQQTTCSASTGCEMDEQSQLEVEDDSFFIGFQAPSLDVILLRLAATAVVLCFGAISFYFLRKKHVDTSLVAHINELEKQLLVASKEAVILREEAVTDDAGANSEELNALQEELEASRMIRADLEEQVTTLERELEEATETGIELNKLLSETLEASKGKAHAGLAASVERLQQQLDSQRDKVDSLTRSLKSTSAENENLKSMVAESKERVSALEAELAAAAEIANNIRREKEEANVITAQELQQVQYRLEEALSSKVLEESRLGSELSTLKLKHETLRSTLSMKQAEIKALQSTLRDLESGSVKADELLDVSKVKAELEHAKDERDTFLEKCQEEEKARKDLQDQLDKTENTISKLKEKADLSEKNKEEAETRLAVLSNYFKEKEEELQKELGLKEAIVAQHQGDESTVVKHLQLLQEEVSTYRAQNESLKKEILDQERDFKGQIATLEKKAHDNWMTARQAERRLEDSRQEAAQLRNRLTLIEKSNADPSTRLDANGEGGVASPVMMMPLPPLGDMETPPPLPPFMFSPPPYPPPFMPPPLPPHPMGRPPPLGRMSSPPPPLGQFSPPPPPYDRLDRSSRSPSPPPHRYPPQPWDAPPPPHGHHGFRPVPKPSPKKPSQPGDHRDHKGSQHSSAHSNETMDKSREHV